MILCLSASCTERGTSTEAARCSLPRSLAHGRNLILYILPVTSHHDSYLHAQIFARHANRCLVLGTSARSWLMQCLAVYIDSEKLTGLQSTKLVWRNDDLTIRGKQPRPDVFSSLILRCHLRNIGLTNCHSSAISPSQPYRQFIVYIPAIIRHTPCALLSRD